MGSMMETNIFLFALLAAVSISGKGAPTSKSLDAYLKYTGADASLNNIGKNIEHSVPEETRFYLASGVYLGRTLIERKVVVTWSFP